MKEGFRDAVGLIELIDRITQDLDQGSMPITIFMDLSKAFDTLTLDILIYKLK